MSEKVSLEAILKSYSDHQHETQDWGGHDRLDTVGASEAFMCARRVAWDKAETPKDTDWVEKRGAMDRGNLIENHWVVPALRQFLPDGLALHGAGDEQQTWVAGWLSCTPDAILTNETDHEIEVDEIVILPGQSMLIEIKSIDPRVDLTVEKPAHRGQVQIQAGIVSWASNYQIVGALLVYVDASFLDDVTIFPVGIDPRVFDQAVKRSDDIFTAVSEDADPDSAATIVTELKPEGKIAGGKECGYCPWFHRCQGANVERIPEGVVKLSPDLIARAAELVNEERMAYFQKKEHDVIHKEAQEAIKKFLAENGTNSVQGPGWSIKYSKVKGRTSYDIEAMREDGVAVDNFMVTSQGSERLTVKGAVDA